MNWLKKNKRTLLLITIGAFVSCLFFNSKSIQTLKGFSISFIWSWIIWTTQWFGNGWIGDWLTKRIPWTKKPILRAVTGVFGLIIYSISAFLLVHVVLSYIVFDNSITESLKWIGVQWFKNVLIISGSIALVLHTIGFFKSWQESKLEAERLRTEMKTYQYDALRNQINPHFLFNSFNVLSELVYEDQSLAVKFIKQLSDIYRYVLDSKDLELVSLQEEIDFIKKFSFLLQTRFEKNLKIDIQVEERPNEFIVPMSLQLLLENAVKHNEISNEYPLKVEIHRNADSIQIKNSLKKKTNPESGTKTGLQNIIKRYNYLSDKTVIVEETSDEFIVEVPILKGDSK